MMHTLRGSSRCVFLVCVSSALCNVVVEAVEPSADSAKPVAVLNFVNRGAGNPKWDWLGKGFADLTIGDLASQSLRVVSREQMQEMLYELALKRQRVDPDAVARILKVTRYIEGSYLVTGDRVELNASIIDAATGEQQHRAAITGDTAAILELQKRLASELADVLLGRQPGTLDPAKLPRWTESLAASQLVYEGIDAFDRGEYLLAWGLFRRAMRQDPRYADGLYWAGRMMYYSQEYHQAAIDLRSFALQYPRHPRVGDAVKELIDAAQQTATNADEVLAAIDVASRLAPSALVHNQYGMGNSSTVGMYAAGLESQILRAKGEYAKALKRWRTVIEPLAREDPLYWIAWHEMFALKCLHLQATGELLPIPPRPLRPDEEKHLSSGKLHPSPHHTTSSSFDFPLYGLDEPMWREFVQLSPAADTANFDFSADLLGSYGFGRTFTRYFYAPPGQLMQSLEVELHYKIHGDKEIHLPGEHSIYLRSDRAFPARDVDRSGVQRWTIDAAPGRRAIPLCVGCKGVNITSWKTTAKFSPIAAGWGTLVLHSHAGREVRGMLDDLPLRIVVGETKIPLRSGKHRLSLGVSRNATAVERAFEIQAGKTTTLKLKALPESPWQVMDTPYEPFRYGAAMGDWSGNFVGDVSTAHDARGRCFVLYRSGRDLYLSQSDNGSQWSPARKLPLPVNSAHDERQPVLIHDGERFVLAFQSDRNLARTNATYVSWSDDLANFSAPVQVDAAWTRPQAIVQRTDGAYVVYAYMRGTIDHNRPKSESRSPLDHWLAYVSRDLVNWSAPKDVFARQQFGGGGSTIPTELVAITTCQGRILVWTFIPPNRTRRNARVQVQASDDGLAFGEPREIEIKYRRPSAVFVDSTASESWLAISSGSSFSVYRCHPTGDLEIDREGTYYPGQWLSFDKRRTSAFMLELPFMPHEHMNNSFGDRNLVWPSTDWVLAGYTLYRSDLTTHHPSSRSQVSPATTEPDIDFEP